MQLRSKISNYMLSQVNLEKVKDVLGNTPFLNSIYKVGSQSLIDYRYPTHLFIESTRACNLGCVCCPRELKPGQKGHMDFNIFKKIVDESTHYGVRNFSLHMLGEPLLHPNILDIVKYIKRANPNHSILLTTNGYFLTSQKSEGLLKNKLDKIAISIFSLDPERSKILTGKEDVARVVENVKTCVFVKKYLNAPTQIYLRMIVSDENAGELPQFYSLAKELGVRTEVRYEGNFGGAIENNFTDRHQLIKKRRYPCYHLWFAPAISWDGKFLMCCLDWKYSEILGDIREQSVASVWQGERLKRLREYHLKGEYDKIPLCAKCNVWSTHPDIFFEKQKR